MARGRKPILVDKIELQGIIDTLEKTGTITSRSALWLAVADTEWAKSIRLTSQVAMLKAKAMNVSITTPLGKKGREKGSGPVPNAGKRRSRKMPLDVITELKAVYEPGLHKKVDRCSKGSMKAAIALKCIDCCGGQKKEVALCTIKNCSLWMFRPYQVKESESCQAILN